MDDNRKKTLLTYTVFIGGTLLLGFLASFFVSAGTDWYEILTKPKLSPPDFLFPIAWTVLYVLMAVGMSRVYLNTSGKDREAAIKIYCIQLAVNLLWSFFFFTLGWTFFSFLWLMLLFVLVIAMTVLFGGTDRLSALLQIPYILWLIFAGYLNLAIYALNR